MKRRKPSRGIRRGKGRLEPCQDRGREEGLNPRPTRFRESKRNPVFSRKDEGSTEEQVFEGPLNAGTMRGGRIKVRKGCSKRLRRPGSRAGGETRNQLITRTRKEKETQEKVPSKLHATKFLSFRIGGGNGVHGRPGGEFQKERTRKGN